MSSPLDELPARMIVSTPAKPSTRPNARRAVTRSWRASRPITATKNGAVLSRTAAIAGPARLVPSASPASESVVPPKPIDGRESPQAQRARQARAEGAEEREQHEEAERAARECRERRRRVIQRDLGDVEGRTPEEHRARAAAAERGRGRRDLSSTAETTLSGQRSDLFRSEGSAHGGADLQLRRPRPRGRAARHPERHPRVRRQRDHPGRA